jgi:sirohydrochlorin cobaltochelatase
MKTLLVLAMHGAPPNDFPPHKMADMLGLQARLEHAERPQRPVLEARYEPLEAEMRAWPRTEQNDPFYAASQELAVHLSEAAGLKVLVGFNEFCAPSLDEVLDQAAVGADQVVVVTPMMTRGGEHAEEDIPAAIQRAQERHADVTFLYAWPFDFGDIARFLTTQAKRFLPLESP